MPKRLLTIPQALEQIRAGRMVIVVDDEDRENEGDLTMAADLITPEAINFMATHGRGLICLAMNEDRVDALGLPMMTPNNQSQRGTAFTVSIDARDGVTTGISAPERAHTIRVAVDPKTRGEDLVAPGHVFPLRARRGGVLVRSGHTEAAIDLSRLAGRAESGVICEIMREDGEMARIPDLEDFADKHELGIVRIADLIQYRLDKELLVRCVAEAPLALGEGRRGWRAIRYQTDVDATEYLALVLGQPQADHPTLVRVQTASALRDVFGAAVPGNDPSPTVWMRSIEEAGFGVFLYVIPPTTSTWLRDLPAKTPTGVAIKSDEQPEAPLRDFGLGAQVLAHLGVGKIRLLTNNPRRIAGLDGFGMQVVECVGSRPAATVVSLRDSQG
ncbi:MAG: 3,4-dihydroxy-2-butanone-4-phosphate synthase [Deltaproteobacteria bacterium]|nr:3,4-dihydroxy-2-butanone-4-phosphate synthase [Deltaproteobacteria bacterium]